MESTEFPLAAKGPRIAMVSARGLGDALLTMTIAYNLSKQGAHVDFYSNVLARFADYFPAVHVLPLDEAPESILKIVADYEFCAFADGIICPGLETDVGQGVFILDRDTQSREIAYTDSLPSRCVHLLMCNSTHGQMV